MMLVARLEHAAREMVATVHRALAETCSAFSNYEAGDHLEYVHADVLADAEAEYEVSEPRISSCRAPYPFACTRLHCGWDCKYPTTSAPPPAEDDPAGGTPPPSAGSPTDPSRTPPPAPRPSVRGEGPSAECDIPLSPAEGHPSPGEFAAVAVREVLAAPLSTGRGHLSIQDARTADWDDDDWFDWRETVAAEVSRRINAAAADARITDRLDAIPDKFVRWFQK